MVKKNYILFFDDDLITSFTLTLSIQLHEPDSQVYQVEDYKSALNQIGKIYNSNQQNQHHQKEICIIIDLNLRNYEGYFFLNTLFKNRPPCPIKIYTIKNEYQEYLELPHLPNSFVSGELEKPIDKKDIKRILSGD